MCGAFNTEGADLAQAFMYAIDQLSDMDILKGVNVGGLAFDSCSNPTRITNTLRNFNSGQYKVTQENGIVVDPGSVQFYTAGKSLPNITYISIYSRNCISKTITTN